MPRTVYQRGDRVLVVPGTLAHNAEHVFEVIDRAWKTTTLLGGAASGYIYKLSCATCQKARYFYRPPENHFIFEQLQPEHPEPVESLPLPPPRPLGGRRIHIDA